MTDPEELWRKAINDMSASLPEDGENAPELENIKKEIKPLGSTKVLVQRILTSVYVFTDVQGKTYTANASQKMNVLGSMSLTKALKIAAKDDFI